MKKILHFLFICLSCSSCAYILNSNHTTLKVRSATPGQLIIQNDTIPINSRVTEVKVKRKQRPLHFKVTIDSLEKDITTRSKLSPTYVWGNMPLLPFYGVGHLLDLLTPRMFTYRRNWYFEVDDQKQQIKAHRFIKQGQKKVFWSLTVPYVNAIAIESPQLHYKNGGFLGMSLGAGRYVNSHWFWEANAGIITDYDFPVYVNPYTRELTSASYLNLTYNYHKSIFNLGVGIGINHKKTRYYETNMFNQETAHYLKTLNLGLVAKAYVRVGDKTHLGLIFQPGFFHFSDFYYDYLLSASLKFKFMDY